VRHAILGAGGVGGLIGAALARAGSDVVVLLRPETLARYGGTLSVESTALGDFEADVPAAARLDRPVDVLWVSTKATSLEGALELAPADAVGDAVVIPLLNGIDHVERLREFYGRVVAGAIRVESERLAPGRIRQSGPFLLVELAGAEPIAEELRAAGVQCSVREDERAVLWDKLAVLAPLALATTALDAPLGGVRGDERFLACQREVFAVAQAEGATIDEGVLRQLGAIVPDAMRTSMQKDVEAGREPELDAIAGPVLRVAARRGIPVPATEELVRMVEARVGG
jgi:2-dehydropantoate 2-reductase